MKHILLLLLNQENKLILMNIITTTKHLNEFIEILENSTDFIAIDTEFKRQNTYYPQLCLIQIATPSIEAIIDPLSKNINLESFFNLMKNTKILKVFFAARQDIEAIFYLNNQAIPTPIFDCQIASMLCGYENNLAFQAIISDLLNINIDKSMQHTDWTIRPLEDRQIEYALKDATLLCKIYIILKEKLEKINRLSWLEEEFNYLTAAKTYDTNPDETWKKIRFSCRTKLDFLILQKLSSWREQQAKKYNLPRLWVLKDAILYNIINDKPEDVFSLKKLLKAKKAKVDNNINLQEIIQIIHKAKNIPYNDIDEIPQPTFKMHQKSSTLTNLQNLLKNVSEKEKIAPSLIATTNSLYKLINGKKNHPTLSGWRYKVFGKFAEDLLK